MKKRIHTTNKAIYINSYENKKVSKTLKYPKRKSIAMPEITKNQLIESYNIGQLDYGNLIYLFKR